MVTPVLDIDVSKDRLDVEIAACGKPRSEYFAHSPDGWRQLLAWLKELKIKRVHACLEATGRYSLGIALALWEAGHIVSIVDPAQIVILRAPSLAATKRMPSMRGTFAGMLKYSSRSPGLRPRRRCGVWANCRPSGLGLSVA